MIAPTPPASLVADLEAYDPKLRLRWAQHIEKWFVERQLDRRHPQLAKEAAVPESAAAIGRDLWDGWREGYVHVLTVPNEPEILNWSRISEALVAADVTRQGSMDMLNKQLDAEDEERERQADKKVETWAKEATSDSYDRLKWLSGERISTIDIPEPAYEAREGYKVRDRRPVAN